MKLLLIILAVATGFLIPFQAAANSAMGRHLPTLFHAALVNFIVGGLVLAVLAFATPGRAGASWTGLQSVPWWGWIAGFVGAGYVAMSVKAAPVLGAVVLLAAVVSGQMLGSVTLDSFGLMGLPKRALTAERAVGLGLVVVGTVLVLRGR